MGLFPNPKKKPETVLQMGSHLSVLKPCPSDPLLFATGGNENDLKVWNFGSSTPVQIFKARNVPHDELDLRVRVWVQDLTFLPRTTELLAMVSRVGHVRLYDTRVQDNRCRPIINFPFTDHPLMSISPTRNDRQVVVGSAQGKVALIDLRGVKEKVVHHFQGFNGSVRSIVADEEGPYFASCGLDRYLYLHHLEEKKPIKKVHRPFLCISTSTLNF